MKTAKLNLKSIFKENKKFLFSFSYSLLALVFILPFQNCGEQGLEFAQQSTDIKYVLVYGDSDSDQGLLANKSQGYARPTLNNIFNQWSRISGKMSYQKASNIIPENDFLYCYTRLDENGVWESAIDPATGKKITPGVSDCANSQPFAAASWSYLSSADTLICAANAGAFVGFVSAVPFEKYENQATLTSKTQDDDTIGLIIATVKDVDGNIHTLSAVRTHGGMAPAKDWGFTYSINGVGIEIYRNSSVGGVFKNLKVKIPGVDSYGWNGRKTIVKVTRDKDQITAYASTWFLDGDILPELDPMSKIEINLSNPEFLGKLDVFKGVQKYGYGSHSQAGASFQNIVFNTLVEAQYLYDLKNKKVYKLIEDGSGRYEVIRSADFFKMLGRNLHVINPETQKAFFIWNDGKYKEVNGDELGL
jgi:hypothetical protein